MGKPWARIEQNFINHQKFLALTANAICFWLEGKNYCDMYQTDGLIPKTALQTFRWRSAKCVELVTRSCGLKPNGAPYAPLWEPVDIGGVAYFRMHDYLDHNECRDEVLARLDDAETVAELRRTKDRARKQRERDARRDELVALKSSTDVVRGNVHETSAELPRDIQTPIEVVVEVDSDPKDPTPPSALAPRAFAPTARSKRPIYSGNRLVVFEWMFDDLLKMLAPYGPDFGLDEWFEALDRRAVANGLILPKDDKGQWLQARTLEEAQRRGLPLTRVSSAPMPAAGKQTTRLMAAVANIHREAQS